MLPIIKPETEIIIKPFSKYHIGDIIVFYHEPDQSILVHRIIKQINECFSCKGDNSFRIERVYPCNILGKVTNVPEASFELTEDNSKAAGNIIDLIKQITS